MMTNVRARWSNGSESAPSLSFAELEEFFARQGATLGKVGLSWSNQGARHYQPCRSYFLLPDGTGVVIGGANNKSPDELRVINADGSERFRLRGPLVVPGEPLLHGKVHLELPREGWPAGRIAFGPIACFESRRAFPVMLDLDWETGTVLGAEQLPRFF